MGLEEINRLEIAQIALVMLGFMIIGVVIGLWIAEQMCLNTIASLTIPCDNLGKSLPLLLPQ